LKIVVTGGAGFIGSHLVDALLDGGHEVTAVDNLSAGSQTNLHLARARPNFRFVKADLKSSKLDGLLSNVDVVYHFAANPEVRVGEVDPQVHFNEGFVSTFRLLESLRKRSKGGRVVFASTSTVYGEADIMPTPEHYGPLLPISTYGASKLGCEALISSYAYTYGLRGLILRYGNVVGSRSNHGIIADLTRKIQGNRNELEILGDGSQKKSYLHVTDCVSATLCLDAEFERSNARVDAYNVSSPDQVGVRRIAEIVAEEMSVPGIVLKFTGGVDGGRGWLGDVKVMQLSILKLMRLGWKPNFDSEGAVRAAAKELAHDAWKGK
jgi:UDP-glucose 4-epimerase